MGTCSRCRNEHFHAWLTNQLGRPMRLSPVVWSCWHIDCCVLAVAGSTKRCLTSLEVRSLKASLPPFSSTKLTSKLMLQPIMGKESRELSSGVAIF